MFVKAKLIRRLYDSPSEEEAKKCTNVLEGKKSPGDLISGDKAAAVQLYGDMAKVREFVFHFFQIANLHDVETDNCRCLI